jgi:hypothetical protein
MTDIQRIVFGHGEGLNPSHQKYLMINNKRVFNHYYKNRRCLIKGIKFIEELQFLYI